MEGLGHKTRRLLVLVPITSLLLNTLMLLLAFFCGTFSMYYLSVATADFQTIQPLFVCVGMVFGGVVSLAVSLMVLFGSYNILKTAAVVIYIPLVIHVLLLLTTFVVITLFFTSTFYVNNALTKDFYILHLVGSVYMFVMLLFTLMFAILLRVSANTEIEE